MSIWPPKPDSLKRPVYRSLARCVIDAVEAGELRHGMKLPTHRALAYELGASVQTISRAYDELARLGYISGEVGRGSFVSFSSSDPAMPWNRVSGGEDIIDCSVLSPVTGDIQAQRMSETLAELSGSLAPSALYSFRPNATFSQHLIHAQRWIQQCGLDAQTDMIIPTNGNTSAMTVALMTSVIPGDLVVTEELGHHTLKSLASSLGLKLSGLTIDEEGIIPEAFERACLSSPVKVLFCMPSAIGPTLSNMSVERRYALCDIARQYNVTIIENDAWGPLEQDRPKPLAAIAPERTLYFTGLSKCLLPGMRLGWLVVPEAVISTARNRHLVTNWMATALMAEIATNWLANGTADELISWQRKQLQMRNALAVKALDGLRFRVSPTGMHVWLSLDENWRENEFVSHARNNGVAVAAGYNFKMTDREMPPGVRMCLGGGAMKDMERAFSVIARLARSAPEPALLAI